MKSSCATSIDVLKLRTDGGYARVRELGSIDLFVVTFFKINQLSPNFEHIFPIMCGVIRLADGRCEMLLVFRPLFWELMFII